MWSRRDRGTERLCRGHERDERRLQQVPLHRKEWASKQTPSTGSTRLSATVRLSDGSVVSPCLAASKSSPFNTAVDGPPGGETVHSDCMPNHNRDIVSLQHRNSSVGPTNPHAHPRAMTLAHVSFPKTTRSPWTETNLAPVRPAGCPHSGPTGFPAPGWIGLATCFSGWSGRRRLEPANKVA
jgi:hypothetical protein